MPDGLSVGNRCTSGEAITDQVDAAVVFTTPHSLQSRLELLYAEVGLSKIATERERLTGELAQIETGLEDGAVAIEIALCLLADPQRLYERMDDQRRRLLNQAFFESCTSIPRASRRSC
jgi:hypothetical protein